MFVRAGFSVALAASAADAMALCATSGFDAVLSDVHMPNVDGHDLVRWIATNHPRTRCVLMSALDVRCDECPIAGSCAFLRKPFDPSKAVEAITRVLAG